MSHAPVRLAIIGGGVSGLAVARNLCRAQCQRGRCAAALQLNLFEADREVGGLVKDSLMRDKADLVRLPHTLLEAADKFAQRSRTPFRLFRSTPVDSVTAAALLREHDLVVLASGNAAFYQPFDPAQPMTTYSFFRALATRDYTAHAALLDRVAAHLQKSEGRELILVGAGNASIELLRALYSRKALETIAPGLAPQMRTALYRFQQNPAQRIYIVSQRAAEKSKFYVSELRRLAEETNLNFGFGVSASANAVAGAASAKLLRLMRELSAAPRKAGQPLVTLLPNARHVVLSMQDGSQQRLESSGGELLCVLDNTIAVFVPPPVKREFPLWQQQLLRAAGATQKPVLRVGWNELPHGNIAQVLNSAEEKTEEIWSHLLESTKSRTENRPTRAR